MAFGRQLISAVYVKYIVHRHVLIGVKSAIRDDETKTSGGRSHRVGHLLTKTSSGSDAGFSYVSALLTSIFP